MDILLGTGGTPEGVITAAAMKCMGGTIQGKLAPRNADELERALELGYDLEKLLMVEDLCGGDQVMMMVMMSDVDADEHNRDGATADYDNDDDDDDDDDMMTLMPMPIPNQQVFFAATGVTDGNLLRGVRYFGGGATTNSIVMRAESGTGAGAPFCDDGCPLL